MLTYVLIGIGGMAVGALLLDRGSRWRHGKGYNELIKEDVDLQWRFIRDIAVTQHVSPFSEFMQTVSPEFCQLYSEASVAERAPLPQAAGLAYAKSLELLIKDYAKRENPGKEAQIESANRAVCVREYLKDDLLRSSSELGVWLRNDQVHYRREYTEHGMSELKGLIHLVVRLIEESERRKKSAADITRLKEQMISSRAGKSTG